VPSPRTVCGFLLAVAAAVSARGDGVDISPFSVSSQSDARTAYHSRGKIVENGPVNTALARVACEAGPLGRLGFWNWDVSSLGGSRQNVHRRAFNEVDVGVFWHYDWTLDDDGAWRLSNDLLKDWITLPGYTPEYHARKSDATISEWRFEQALVNPYVTPYYLLRKSVHPHQNEWFYARVGARHGFGLPYDLTFTPTAFAEMGNGRHFERRYGAPVDGSLHHHSGVQALNLILELSWKATRNLSVYANVQQFGLVDDDARECMKAKDTHEARRDLTIFSLGLRARF